MNKNKSNTRLFSVILHILTVFCIFLINIFTISCIKRNNEFDPIFKHKMTLSCTQDTLINFRGNVLGVLAHSDLIRQEELQYKRTIFSNDSALSLLLISNDMVQISNSYITLENIEIDNSNKVQNSVDSLHYKKTLSSLLFAPDFPTAISRSLPENYQDSIELDSLFTGMNNRCPDFEDSVKTLHDSAIAVFTDNSLRLLSLRASIDSIKGNIGNINVWIFDSNIIIKQKNNMVQLYNDSIHSLQWAVRIKNFPLIATGELLNQYVDQALPGDTFVIEGALEFDGNVQFSSIRGTAYDHIAFIGNPQTENSLSIHGGIFADSSEYIDFSNLTITGSRGSGIKIENHSNNITFINCIIEGNERYGIEIITSGITLTDCIIRNNGQGGIKFDPRPTDCWMNLSNVLIAKNNGVGLDLTTPQANVKYVTISSNTADGIRIVSPMGSNLSVFNSIISYNIGFGIARIDDGSTGGTLDLSANDFYQNSSGNFSGNISETGWNYDPNFSDTTNNDFSIAPWGTIFDFETQQNLIIGYR
jgi:hypothetical protein